VNVGGKIFRAHHDEVNKGLIAANSADISTAKISLDVSMIGKTKD
jgi:hypothetical protein